MAQSASSITFVINSLEGGGAERMLCKLLHNMQNEFEQQQLDIRLLMLDSAQELQVCPSYVQKHRFDSRGSLLKSYTNLRRFLRDNPTQLLVSFLTRSNYVCCLLARQLGIPAIISERVNTSNHFGSGGRAMLSKLLVRVFYPLADRVLAVSEGVKSDLVENFALLPNKVQVMYNAYDIEQLHALSLDPISFVHKRAYIIAIGRLVANKNFQLLLQAYAKSNTDKDLVILGQGPEQTALVALAHQLNIQDRVHFLGFQANPYPYLTHAEYLVSSSNAEGFPNAVAEALCFGKPVIATNCPSGPAEILADDSQCHTNSYHLAKFGILCQPNNKQALTAAINQLEQADVFRHYQQASLARRHSFSTDKMRNCFLHALNQLSPDKFKLEPQRV